MKGDSLQYTRKYTKIRVVVVTILFLSPFACAGLAAYIALSEQLAFSWSGFLL